MINLLPRRRKKTKTAKFFTTLIALILAGLIFYFYTLNVPNSNSPEVKTFVIKPGWGSTKISEELKKQDLIRSKLVFQFYVWTQGISHLLQDGEYFLASNLNIAGVADILNRGAGTTKEISLTFIEGWNNDELANYLEKQGIVSSEDFFFVVQKKADWWDEYEFLNNKPRNLDLEGYLFPDTYRVFRDASAEDVVKKMLDNLDHKLTPDLRLEIENQGKTVHEILTLASIIEKEVPSDEDKKLVADIFYKRLDAGIALQADSTVNYVTGKKSSRATAADLEIDSLYNTYKYKDLPPGPISNPGFSSILAAIYPKHNPYYYFLTTPTGEVIYNVTHDEHVKDKNKYY